MLGISVYLTAESIQDQEGYFQKVSEKGFKSIFTSLHIPEADPSVYKERLQELGQLSQKYGMELMADISPKSLQYLGLTWDHVEDIVHWGVTGLRIDYGIEDERIASLSAKMKVALNASTLTEEQLEKLVTDGLNLSRTEAWHNFYPRPETGLSLENLQQRNLWLKNKGLTTMAFIPGDHKLRGPLFQGLPTLEDHREASPFAAFMDLREKGFVDKILVGDIELSDTALEQFSSMQDGVILLRAQAFVREDPLTDILTMEHTNRYDEARDCIRSMESRQYGLIGHRAVKPFHTTRREIGSITVDNELYGRYQGEIQITKTSLKPDEKVNVIGKVIEADIPLLPYIKAGRKFKIQWV